MIKEFLLECQILKLSELCSLENLKLFLIFAIVIENPLRISQVLLRYWWPVWKQNVNDFETF